MSLAEDISKLYSSVRWDKKYKGPIFTFDLDKTYLATKFENFTKLVKIPFEKAKDKVNIPGVVPLVRELKNKNEAPLFFISGSPKGMKNVIEEKLKLDKIKFDGLLLKDFGDALKKFQIEKIIDKIGYKLSTLLYGRMIFPKESHEILFGDDSEYDASIYSLYADIVSGRIQDFEVLTILKRWKVSQDEFELIRKYLTQFKEMYPKPRFEVKKIFIHLETKTSPLDHMTLSNKVTPTHNYFQTAVILYEDSYINRRGLLRVIINLIKDYNFNISHFTFSVQDLLTRQLLDKKEGNKLHNMISKGNPLALPLKILNELKSETSNLLGTFAKAPMRLARKPFDLVNVLKGGKPDKEDRTPDIVKRYILYTPRRNV